MTKFTLNKKDFSKNFFQLFKLINTSTVLPILETVMVRYDGKEFTFTSSDLENTFDYKIPLHSCTPFDFCIDGRSLSNIIKNSISDELGFQLNDKNIVISSGDFKVTMNIYNYLDYPKPPTLEKKNTFIISSLVLKKILNNSINFNSKDYLRPALTGVFFECNDGNLNIVSTDGHKMFYKQEPIEQAVEGCFKVIVHHKCCKLLINSFDNEPIVIHVSDKYTKICGLQTTITSRNIEANYPSWRSVIPKPVFSFNLMRKDLRAFIKIALPFCHHYTNEANITINNETIKMLGVNDNLDSSFEYSLPVYNASNSFSINISVNIKFLKTILSVNSKDEYVKFDITESGLKAVTIDGCCLFMPIMGGN